MHTKAVKMTVRVGPAFQNNREEGSDSQPQSQRGEFAPLQTTEFPENFQNLVDAKGRAMRVG